LVWRVGTVGILGTAAYGVYGKATTTAAVFGENPAAGTYAMLGSSRGVLGGDGNGNTGMLAGTVGSRECGVAGSGEDFGVYGSVHGSEAKAVAGEHMDSGSIGMLGTIDHGVYGRSSSGSAVYADGDLVVTGEVRGLHGNNHGAPFPRPVFDSGCVSIDHGEQLVLDHGIGGDEDDYVVDLTFRDPGSDVGVNAIYLGGAFSGAGYRGASWRRLTSQDIGVFRYHADTLAPEVRIRVWVIGS
jgi:hypothetical protein